MYVVGRFGIKDQTTKRPNQGLHLVFQGYAFRTHFFLVLTLGWIMLAKILIFGPSQEADSTPYRNSKPRPVWMLA